jgi:hypothetical protein
VAGGQRSFQHARTGYALAGQHAKLRCEACHARSRLVAPDVVKTLAAQPGRNTFLGLSTRCASCHFDEHRGQLGQLANDCQRCHNEADWRPTAGFDHQRTDFPLRGKHQGVACARCHATVTADRPPGTPPFLTPRAATFLQMKPVDHATCASCHDDPHDGKLGPRCASCHTETSWRAISTDGGGDRAFHKRTAFPLTGAHAAVACRSCHGPFPGAPARFKGLAFARCADCHEDAHVGQLAGAGGRAPDCAACHDTSAFAPPRFELEQHATTRFPLDGAHRTAACRGCHPVDARLESLVPAAVRNRLHHEHRPPLQVSLAVLRPQRSARVCSGCHDDVHEGQFAEEMRAQDCRACHQTSSFTALTFDHDLQSRFPLTGAHLTTACASCHPRGIQSGTLAGFPGPPAKDSARQAELRPRDQTGTLAGQAERSLRAGAPPAVRYRPLPVACDGCHADSHQGQFTWEATPAADGAPRRRRDARDCSFCHGTASFQATLFSHDDVRFTRFPLRGQHASLSCDACHRTIELSGGVRTVRYRPLPHACAGCHADFHKGDFRGFQP